MFDLRRVGKVRRIGQIDDLTVCLINFVNNTRCGRDKIKVVLPFESLLDYLKMKKSQKSAAESESERDTRFRFIVQRRIIELEFFERITKVRILCSVCGIHSAEHHRLNLLISRKRLITRLIVISYRITDHSVTHVFDRCRKISDHPCGKLITWYELACAESPHLNYFGNSSGRHHPHTCSPFYFSVHHPEEHNDALV